MEMVAPVSGDRVYEKVKVTTRFGIRIRSTPEIKSGNIVGKVDQGFISDVLEFHQGEKYRWAKIGENKWIVADERIVDIIPIPVARIKIHWPWGIHVFDRPDIDNGRVEWIAKQDSIHKVFEFITDTDGHYLWARIGRDEWISINNQEVSVMEINEDTGDKLKIIINALRIRSAPKIESGNIVGFAYKGETFSVLQYTDDSSGNTWAKIGEDKWISSNSRFVSLLGPHEDFEIGAWPTEQIFYPGTDAIAIILNFGIPSPEYSEAGLPGNDGLILYAPQDTDVFTVAKGFVSDVGDMGNGTYVVVDHTNGYTTRYRDLGNRIVGVDVILGPGDKIGIVGQESKMHFSMTHKDGLDGWPNGIIDPTNILMNYIRESLR